MSDADPSISETEASWQPIGRLQRRVLGVLVEKAKTTPDNYPLTLASLVAGCNQKSNRSPQMQVDEDEVTDALESLRGIGAVREVQGSGRVNKYRHAAYEWLQVNAPQAAVMTELLLRGPQTAGELRSRASRMEPFADLETLSATLGELQQKGLVIPLTPPGRGQVFAHALYLPDELRRLQQEAGGQHAAGEHRETEVQRASGGGPPQGSGETGRGAAATSDRTPPPAGRAEVERAEAGADDLVQRLLGEIEQLRERVERLEREVGLEDA